MRMKGIGVEVGNDLPVVRFIGLARVQNDFGLDLLLDSTG